MNKQEKDHQKECHLKCVINVNNDKKAVFNLFLKIILIKLTILVNTSTSIRLVQCYGSI